MNQCKFDETIWLKYVAFIYKCNNDYSIIYYIKDGVGGKMKEHSCINSTNKSGKSVSGSVSYHRKSSPLPNGGIKNNKSLKEGYVVRDDGDWGTTEMRLRGIKK